MDRRASGSRARNCIALLGAAAAIGLAAYLAVDDERVPEHPHQHSRGLLAPRRLFPRFERGDQAAHGAEIVGSVLTAVGAQPIAGARVCASCANCPLTRTDSASCTLSDANGAFSLKVDNSLAFVLSAQASGFVTGYARGGQPLRVSGGAREQLRIHLAQGRENIEGMVIDALGGPVAQARVRLVRYVDALTPTLEVLADEEGRFSATVPQGSVTLRAEAGGYAPTSATYIAPSRDIILALTPESWVHGTVVEAGTGKRVPGVSIIAHPQNAAPRHPETTSNESGEFDIRGLDPGRYLFVAEGDRHRGETRRPVEVGLVERITGVQIEVEPAALVVGKVELSGTGEPCPQGRAILGPEGPLTIPLGPGQSGDEDVIAVASTIRHDGSVRFQGVPAGRYHVMIQCLHHVYESGPALVDTRDATPPLLWKVRPGHGLHVRVVTSGGRPAANAKLSLEFPEVKGRRALTPLATDQDGEAITPRNLRIGTYRIHPDPAYGARPLSVEVPSKGGVTAVTLTLPGSAELMVSVKTEGGEAVDGAWVISKRTAGPSATAMPTHAVQAAPSGGTGAGSAGSLPLVASSAGAGLLMGNADAGFPTMRATALGEGKYRLGPLVPATYRIEVRDGDNPPVVVTPALLVHASQRSELTAVVSRGGTIQGKVVDEQGNATANAWVKAEYQGRPPSSLLDNLGRESQGVGLTRVLSDDEGAFRLERLAKSAVYDLRAEKHHGGVVEQRAVREGSTVSLKLPSPGELRGVVVDESGKPVSMYEISASLLNLPQAMRSLQVVSREGRFHLEGVPAGRVQVQVTGQNGQMVHQVVDLAPNQRLDSLRLSFLAPPSEQALAPEHAEPASAGALRDPPVAPTAPLNEAGDGPVRDVSQGGREDEAKPVEGA